VATTIRAPESLAAQGVVLRHHLHGEFTGGNQRERRDPGSLFLQHALDDWNQERECLARSGLRGREHVFTR
jgi:hypothetical protein